MVQDLNDRYLKHTVRVNSPWLPFIKRNKPTAFYYIDKFRYGKWFGSNTMPETEFLYEDDWKRRDDLQALYQRQCEENGQILTAIWSQTADPAKWSPREYLSWLAAQWNNYLVFCEENEDEPLEFMDFVRSDK